MNEKQDFLNLIQNISEQFSKDDITDYQTVLFLLRTLIKNKEQDEEILNKAQNLIEQILLQNCNCDNNNDNNLNEFEMAYQNIYAKNGIRSEELSQQRQAYQDLHEQRLDIVSFRLFSPRNMNFNYNIRLD